ncbi:3-demethylubiquinone-9 3-methyltransferase [Lentzea aerocolonigenes]|uniref:3-demethylubiquinone-9 3-methyltransferase n=1 Tax=Lentzea aerocolonigenes TaxID=68170 RepID=A0A0F0GS89_LENAE|nr:VOC family protein [Lentzea aerocolonigenes]KJK44852.1 3-demethylubiquinone-9 3-methyltransferase [Lentzea aerocolonigenes]
MATRLNPYLRFDGSARQAMEFYQSIFGGELRISTFGEFGMQDSPQADQIMHAQLETESGYTLMASDTPPGMPYNPGDTITISLSGDDEVLRTYFEQLADGGKVGTPLEKQMWGDEYGDVVDKYGINWLVNIGSQG